MTEEIKTKLEVIQTKIQNIKSDTGNSGILQQYIDEAGRLIGLFDTNTGTKMIECRDELYFYSDGGTDNLAKFYKCKSEVLTIISQKMRN